MKHFVHSPEVSKMPCSVQTGSLHWTLYSPEMIFLDQQVQRVLNPSLTYHKCVYVCNLGVLLKSDMFPFLFSDGRERKAAMSPSILALSRSMASKNE